jgi:hypothetical protein
MSHAAFARVDPFAGLVAHSPEVLGMAHCLDSPDQSPRPFGAYCFKLNFTPTSVIANAIAHPNDNEFNPILYTAGPNVTGQFTKDKNGRGVECPAGFQHAAVGPTRSGRRNRHSARRLLRNVLRLISLPYNAQRPPGSLKKIRDAITARARDGRRNFQP